MFHCAEAAGRRVVASLLAIMLVGISGCAAITSPIVNGIPVRLLPPELLADSKDELKPIPLTWLSREAVEDPLLGPGDILGVHIEGVLGEKGKLPPIHYPDVADRGPSVGFPIPVRESGLLPLPFIDPIRVEGLTIEQAEQKIIEAYSVGQKIVRRETSNIFVTLAQSRKARIQVIREDTPNRRTFVPGFGSSLFSNDLSLTNNLGQGTGTQVDLPAPESDVLAVLAMTGGLPGPNAANEVVVLRQNVAESRGDEGWTVVDLTQGDHQDEGTPGERSVRIPLRWPEGSPRPFHEQDIILNSGDVVLIPALDPENYYTGGLLPPREVPLPRDQDIRAVEAVMRIGGPILGGGVNTRNLQGTLIAGGLGNPNPSLLSVLRRLPDGRQVNIRVDLNQALRDPRENILIQAGDILVLQETPAEAVARYVSQVFNFSIFGNIFSRQDAAATGQALLP